MLLHRPTGDPPVEELFLSCKATYFITTYQCFLNYLQLYQHKYNLADSPESSLFLNDLL